MGLIQDVVPYSNKRLITTLHRRGVRLQDIFAQYYAEEEMAAHQDDEMFGSDEAGQHGVPRVTIADAELAAKS